jgi:hypothetical protein
VALPVTGVSMYQANLMRHLTTDTNLEIYSLLITVLFIRAIPGTISVDR